MRLSLVAIAWRFRGDPLVHISGVCSTIDHCLEPPSLDEPQRVTLHQVLLLDQLAPDTEYALRLALRNQEGRGAWSSVVKGETQAETPRYRQTTTG